MKRYRLIIPITLGLCLMVQASWATKAYVTDSFRISLRAGPSIENKILKFLSSGTYLEVMETGESWSNVRLLEPEGKRFRPAKQSRLKLCSAGFITVKL